MLVKSAFWLLVLSSVYSFGQPSNDPIGVVLEALSDPCGRFTEESIVYLEANSWETLAYWIPNEKPDRSQVQEAVADVYRWNNGVFEGFVYNQNIGERQKIKGRYKVVDSRIKLFMNASLKEFDSWTICYLDANYLVLDMGDLKVFLVPPDQDPF